MHAGQTYLFPCRFMSIEEIMFRFRSGQPAPPPWNNVPCFALPRISPETQRRGFPAVLWHERILGLGAVANCDFDPGVYDPLNLRIQRGNPILILEENVHHPDSCMAMNLNLGAQDRNGYTCYDVGKLRMHSYR